MRILVLNWRDIKNPIMGGAEVATHELAKEWVLAGHSVTQFSSYFTGAKQKEVIDNIHFIRKGDPDIRSLHKSVQFEAYKFYKKNQTKFDMVIDEIHGIPFFTPLYVKKKKVLFVCEVAQNLWYEMFGPIIGTVGKYMEVFALKFVYRQVPFLTISASTKKDLQSIGIQKEKIDIVTLGFTKPTGRILNIKKEKELTVTYLGRLTKPKGIEDMLEAFKIIKNIIPMAKLWIIGSGVASYENFVKDLSRQLGIVDITFKGFLPEKEKFVLLRKSHILGFPSIREGWGLTALEANSVKTAVVAYRSVGLVDSVVDDKTGILCKKNSPEELAKNILLLWKNKQKYAKLLTGGYEWSQSFNWRKAGKQSLVFLEKYYESN